MWIENENYPCKQHEVLESSVEMCFFLELHNHLKVQVVYVRIHPEQALEDRPDDLAEVWREWSPCWHHNFKPENMVRIQTKILNQNTVLQLN